MSWLLETVQHEHWGAELFSSCKTEPLYLLNNNTPLFWVLVQSKQQCIEIMDGVRRAENVKGQTANSLAL